MQRRRVHAQELGAMPLDTFFTQTFEIDETNGVNVHGLRWCVSVMTTGAVPSVSQGTWVCFCIPDETSAIPGTDIGNLEGEGANAFIWGVGMWSASVGTPAMIEFNPGTSRNCQNGARIVMRLRTNILVGTSPTVAAVVTYFTKSL